MRGLLSLWCAIVGHRWTGWSNAGPRYSTSFRWCRRCDASEVRYGGDR